MSNVRGKIVSKRQSAHGKKCGWLRVLAARIFTMSARLLSGFKHIEGWVEAVMEARR